MALKGSEVAGHPLPLVAATSVELASCVTQQDAETAMPKQSAPFLGKGSEVGR